MRLASAILATPIKLRGRPTQDLPGEEEDVDLITNDERCVLEIYQGGKLVAMRHLSLVVDMRPAEKGYKCPEPGCKAAYDDPKGLGPHMRHKHGMKGDGPADGR